MTPLKFSLVSVVLIFASLQSIAQEKRYYVVVGAFRSKDNASRFTASAAKNSFEAHYALRASRSLYYVYILDTDIKKDAFNLLIKTKVETIYKDAWVFIGKLETGEPAQEAIKEMPKEQPGQPVIEVPPVQEPIKEPVIETPKVDSSALVKKELPKPVEVKKPLGKPFYFKAMSKEGKELTGTVHVQEAKNATQFQLVKLGDVTYLETPKNTRGEYTVTAQVPGYKQSSISFPYNDNSFEKGKDNENVVTLTLEKASRGDYIDFNNVHFITNSSLLKPESQDELDGLVTLMKENLKYKIKIYGHCNGTRERDATTLGTGTNFFAVDPTLNKRGKISSKELSLARAETVKAYLVQQGIDASRISTKGEGGKVPLYPEGGSLGQYNDRVEIEFTKN